MKNNAQPAAAAARWSLESCGAWLSIAFVLRAVLAMAWPTLYHPDEVFQSLEPAHRLAFGYGVISWEWRYGIRNWVFPGFLAGVMRATAWMSGWMGVGSHGYLIGTGLVLALLSLSAVWFGWAWAKKVAGPRAGMLAAIGCSLYFGLAFLASKALSEAIATYVLLPGLYLGIYGERFGERKRVFAAAFFCTLAAALRVQLAPAVLFALVYFCWPNWRKRWAPVLAGALLPTLAFGGVDWLTWGVPWHSFLANIAMNVLEGKSLHYGVAPWFTYLWVLPVLLFPACLFWPRGIRRCPFLAIFILVFVASHSVIAHKEERFLLPVVPLCLTLTAIGIADRRAQKQQGFTEGDVLRAGALFFLLPSLAMGAVYAYFESEPATQGAMNRLSVASGVCGVGYYSLPWTESGGYAHLHLQIPVIPMQKAEELAQKSGEFNVLIAPKDAPGLPADYIQSGCQQGVCIDRRPGGCMPSVSQNAINAYLRRQDE